MSAEAIVDSLRGLCVEDEVNVVFHRDHFDRTQKSSLVF